MLFWALLLLVVLGEATADCVQGFIPEGKRRPIEVNVPRMAKTWKQMMDTCSRKFDGRRLISIHVNLTEKVRKSCGDTLVPVDFRVEIDDVPASGNRDSTMYELSLMDRSYRKLKEGVGALNLTTGLWHFVDQGHLFSCVVCDMSLKYILDQSMGLEEDYLGDAVTFLIRLVSLEVHNGEASLQKQERRGIIAELDSLSDSPIINKFNHNFLFRQVYLDANKHLVIIFHCDIEYSPDPIVASQYKKMFEDLNGVHQTPLLKKYDIYTDNITECPREVTVDQGNRSTIWPQAEAETVQLSWDSSSGIISRRSCGPNDSLHRNVWLAPTRWEVVWMPCTPEDQLPNGAYYQKYFNGATKYKHSNRLIAIYVFVGFFCTFLRYLEQ